jgi:transketolase
MAYQPSESPRKSKTGLANERHSFEYHPFVALRHFPYCIGANKVMHSQHTLQPLAHAIRFLAVDAILAAGEGHQGVPLGMAEIATALYTQHLKHDPTNPTWFDRDRVVLSNGHGSMLLYALLYLNGYEKMSLDQLKAFRVLGSHCAGHPEIDPAAGIELTTGQLGQGIANALGMAIAEAKLRAQFGADLVNHYTYAFVGDGCLQEGVGQEMISLAGHLGLGHLILLWDDNAIQDDGATMLSISENVSDRFRVANWHVVEVDGHDIDAVTHAIAAAKLDARPSMIACKTTIAKGVARLQGQRGGHSGKLFAEDRAQMQAMFDSEHRFDKPFEVPADILSAWRASSQAGQEAQQAWKARVASLSADTRLQFERIMRGDLPQNLGDAMQQLKAQLASDAPIGGINLSAAISHALTPHLPERMIACADLEAPTDHKRGQQAFTPSSPAGSYVHCGVREHVMGSLCNGMAAHGGVLPVAVTYLVFSDYLRPAMRNAALMGLPVKFVFSHDSIGIGTNGPTHQPVEILASLRAMPNMLVLRPADAVEAVECWDIALKHKTGPVSLIFARQVLPHVRADARLRGGEKRIENASARGGYVVSDTRLGKRQVTLLSTGSEVAIALAAQKQLEAQGVATAVVSLPCFELFDAQDVAYRQATLGKGCTRVAVEAAVVQGWEKYIGDQGAFVGMTGFGLSGAAKDLYEHFCITAQAVVAKAKECLAL